MTQSMTRPGASMPVQPSKLLQAMLVRHPDRYSLDSATLRYSCPKCGVQEPLHQGGGIYMRRECRCAHIARLAARDAAEAQEYKRLQAARLLHSAYSWLDHYNPALIADHRRLGHMTPPDRLEAYTFASWHNFRFKDAFAAAQILAQHIVQKQTWLHNLIFVGDPGTGKTHLMAAITGEVTSHGIPVRFSTAKTLFDLLYAAPFDEKAVIMHELGTCPLWCLDELDKLHIKQGGGDFQRKTLQNILNDRNRHHLPTVITANEQQDFSPWLEESSLSRLFDCDGPGGGKTLLTMVGDDYRLLRAAGVSLWNAEGH